MLYPPRTPQRKANRLSQMIAYILDGQHRCVRTTHSSSLVGWRPSQVCWRPSLLVARTLVGWRCASHVVHVFASSTQHCRAAGPPPALQRPGRGCGRQGSRGSRGKPSLLGQSFWRQNMGTKRGSKLVKDCGRPSLDHPSPVRFTYSSNETKSKKTRTILECNNNN